MLTLAGAHAGGGCSNLFWATLEAGGRDDGAGGGGAGNFGLRELALAANAAVALVDYRDNGNRNGPAGSAEVVYVETLTLGAGAMLNLNGLRVYVAGQPGPVAPGPYGAGSVVDQRIVRVGDVNVDGRVDFLDINAFVGVLTGAITDPVAICAADCNGDGRADFRDINPFVALLSH